MAVPRLPGRAALKDLPVPKGGAYKVKPAANARAVPAHSRRALLAGEVARADNAAFKRNFANRAWALLMGRGLVHPLDLDHADNPPSHPELLDLLADEAAAHQFDLRWLLREVALSKTYQRSSIAPEGTKPEPHRYAAANLKPLSPEALAWSLFQATGMADAERRALGERLTEEALYKRVSGQVAPLVRTFASAPGESEDFQPTFDQALALSNGALVRGWLAPRPGNLADRLSKLSDAGAAAEEAYLSVLSRRPTAEEVKEVEAYLGTPGKDRAAALQEVVWALLTSAEFRFNH
jgi:hypothetical protein